MAMERELKITIQIYGKKFKIPVMSPEEEARIRKAAKAVNDSIGSYLKNFPGQNLGDILSLVALNIENEKMILCDRLQKYENAEKLLHDNIKSYLENIEN